MSATCEICGKEFKNTQGLRGHMTFIHGQAGSSKIVSAPAATEQPVSRLRARLGLTDSKTEPITEQLSNIENRLNKLEHVTGVRETDELEKLLGITDTPLTERVAQLTEQLSKLTEQLKSEYVSRETMETVTAEQVNKLMSQLSSAQTEDRKLGREITRCHCDLEQLEINLKRLSRFVQYEFAGVDDDIVWEICQDRPELKKKYIKPKR